MASTHGQLFANLVHDWFESLEIRWSIDNIGQSGLTRTLRATAVICVMSGDGAQID